MIMKEIIQVPSLHNHLLEEQPKGLDEHPLGCWSKPKKWLCRILVMSMIILFVTVLVLLIVYPRKLGDIDRCGYDIQAGKPHSYNLFGTKTQYSTVFNLLNKSSASSYDLPELLTKSDMSLEQLDKTIREGSTCKPVRLHYFSRHAARYPSGSEMNKMKQLVEEVQSKIILPSARHQTPNSDANSSNATECSDFLAYYKRWVPQWSAVQDNMIMQSGYQETDLIAKRLQSIYPEFFDAKTSDIKVKTTNKVRTAHTALVFMKNFKNYNPPGGCKVDDYHTNSSDPAKAKEVLDDQCYSRLTKATVNEDIAFHETCDNLVSYNKTIDIQLTSDKRVESIIKSVSANLKLSDPLSATQVESLYKVCKYESALLGSSKWCELFREGDLRMYEFLADVDDYLNQAVFEERYRDSTCPAFHDMLVEYSNMVRDQNLKPQANYHFTHAEVIQRMFAVSTIEQIGNTKLSEIRSLLDKGEVDDNSLRWRSSFYSPFSANLMFAVYECQGTNNSHDFKLVSALNERPFHLDHCNKTICPLRPFVESFDGILQYRTTCNMPKVCAQRTKYT